MVTDTKTNNLRIVLHQIYVSLYVEYVVKNPLSPVEHPGGTGVNCEMFELGVEQFVVCHSRFKAIWCYVADSLQDGFSAELILVHFLVLQIKPLIVDEALVHCFRSTCWLLRTYNGAGAL